MRYVATLLALPLVSSACTWSQATPVTVSGSQQDIEWLRADGAYGSAESASAARRRDRHGTMSQLTATEGVSGRIPQ